MYAELGSLLKIVFLHNYFISCLLLFVFHQLLLDSDKTVSLFHRVFAEDPSSFSFSFHSLWVCPILQWYLGHFVCSDHVNVFFHSPTAALFSDPITPDPPFLLLQSVHSDSCCPDACTGSDEGVWGLPVSRGCHGAIACFDYLQ